LNTSLQPSETKHILAVDGLTMSQISVYKAIISFFKENQYMPTIRELAEMLNCYPNSIQDKLRILENKGYISRAESKSRSIKLTKLKVELASA